MALLRVDSGLKNRNHLELTSGKPGLKEYFLARESYKRGESTKTISKLFIDQLVLKVFCSKFFCVDQKSSNFISFIFPFSTTKSIFIGSKKKLRKTKEGFIFVSQKLKQVINRKQLLLKTKVKPCLS